MLIYEKKVSGVTHLFGTTGRIPTAEDIQLTYKDADGDVVADVANFKFFFNRDGAIYANNSTKQIPSDDATKINVYLGANLIIGNND